MACSTRANEPSLHASSVALARQNATTSAPAVGSAFRSEYHAITQIEMITLRYFDPASLEILDRLNRIMNTQQDVLKAVRDSSNLETHTIPDCPSSESYSLPRTVLSEKTNQAELSSRDPAANIFGVTSSNTSPDNVLIWPIFLGNYAAKCLQDALFSLSSSGPYGNQSSKKLAKFPFQEDKVSHLMERFFQLVHIKNPILDPEELQEYSRIVIEDGLSWDEGSCLVLLACALGRIAQPFVNGQQMENFDPFNPRDDSSSFEDSDLAEAESFFYLARRRIGVLDQSIAAVQGFFLCGVYYMYTFRPLDAFQSFHQASVIYQIYSKSRKGPTPVLSDSKTEQTLFWSCFKSEWYVKWSYCLSSTHKLHSEILSEIDLPSSGVSCSDYIDVFPNPPHSDASAVSSTITTTPGSRGRVDHSLSNHGQEQAWFYYLSEIALRRIGNRVLSTFYKENFTFWKELDIVATIQIANEFFRQLNMWYECLPVPMHFDSGKPGAFPDNELPYLLYTRYQEIRSWIFRPFLFLAIHLPPNNIHRSSLDDLVAESGTPLHTAIMERGICFG
ncbi:hypothetical protein N7466_011385 [Penicillium verhagenii]|uniref:uncharacterized protein n=1 Tax=Penicillium verhagenii TaxID=1562060 RepID=UPI002544F3E3|nr:uncharacterized protein N7466_011385 [Penicillium verhagenii]KAJ5915452.1 hypothetical protein N7466_011385 [Penicillium verhagenii]